MKDVYFGTKYFVIHAQFFITHNFYGLFVDSMYYKNVKLCRSPPKNITPVKSGETHQRNTN